jgi:hypothetical protein
MVCYFWNDSWSVLCIFQYWEQGAEWSDIFETIVDLYFVFFSIGSSKVWYLWDNSWSVLCIFQYWEQTKYRSSIVSKMSDHSAPCSQYWKIQSTDQLSFQNWQTILLPASNTEKYKVLINYCFTNIRPCSSLLPMTENYKVQQPLSQKFLYCTLYFSVVKVSDRK